MFAPFMLHAWEAGTLVAVVAGLVGFFVVLRGSAFAAHALPQGAFTGAAGATLIGVTPIAGIVTFSVLGALGIGWVGRRGRRDVATALVLATLLAAGALFLGLSSQYADQTFALLFGSPTSVSPAEVDVVAVLAVVAVSAVTVAARPLLLSSIMPELGEAKRIQQGRIDAGFLLIVSLATAVSLPVVGALLTFSLMVGPPAAARSLVTGSLRAALVSAVLAAVTVWVAIAVFYETDLPASFVVGAAGIVWYLVGRAAGRPGRRTRITPPSR